MESFLVNIYKLYDKLLESKDSISKLNAIDECKSNLGIQLYDTIGSFYYRQYGNRKDSGTVYTPTIVADYMLTNTIKKEDIINNPFLKIVDPSCGIGNIIIPCFIYLKKLFEDNLEEINRINNLNIELNGINNHIIKNNLYGVDIDLNAIIILQIDLFYLSRAVSESNYLHKDFLQDDISMKFDIFIGNPPYVGHKSINKTYRKKIALLFNQLYKDKGDLSYCFFYKSMQNIKYHGKITFITSRYFIESLNGEVLRKYLLDNFSIEKIVDFYGIRPFKNVGIDPVILFLEAKVVERKRIDVLKAENTNVESTSYNKDVTLLNKFNFQSFKINREQLGLTPWIIINDDKRKIINKIESKSSVLLSDISITYQGIITGCDKAFIIHKDQAKNYNIENELLRPWIKSSNICRNSIIETEKYIIYSNLISSEVSHPQAIRYISRYKDKLLERRECIKNIRKWYELQWGRKREIFEGKKIIFPYKSEYNRFTLDKGSYFSADIYAIKLKSEESFSYDLLLKTLNSKLYNFYFKAFAKKLGGNLYEYYPNNLNRLKIPMIRNVDELDDSYLYDYFQLTKNEIKLIEESK